MRVLLGGRSSVEINSTIATGNFSVSLFYFVAAFLVLFQLMFTTEYAGSVLLRFLNTLFVTLRKALRLPVTPATVRAQIGFDHLTEHLVKYSILRCQYVDLRATKIHRGNDGACWLVYGGMRHSGGA